MQWSDSIVGLHGQAVKIYGKGLYQNDSVTAAAQAIPQDIVTMVIGIPLLLISLFLARKGLLKGRLLLAGTLAYFTYTYVSYTFILMYNQLFIMDVLLMSASLYAFILTMMSFDVQVLSKCFSEKLPVKYLGISTIFFISAIGLMWLKMILQPLFGGTFPAELEHYNTLVIQAMDLGIVLPAGILSGILIIKRKPFGYLLSSVITIKAITMVSAMTAMTIGQILAGIEVSVIMCILVPVFNLIFIFSFYLIMKNMKEPASRSF